MATDETFAHFLPHNIFFGSHNCFLFSLSKFLNQQLFSTNCNGNNSASFLCKAPARVEETSPQMPVAIDASWSVDVVQCPLHHITRTFLACDVNSQCWADTYDSSRSCDTLLTSLPPSFACANEIQFVPYTLVCDHRPDCSDSSDEYFCVFPSCPPHQYFRCTNNQVRGPARRVMVLTC